MSNTRIACPYCGEEISANAKKCRYCGEWLQQPNNLTVSNQQPSEIPVAQPLEVAADGEYTDALPAANPMGGVPMQQGAMPVQPNVNVMAQPGATPVTNGVNVMPQINISLQQTQEVQQEQTVIVEHSSSGSGESDGFLWFQVGAVAFGVWIAATWWAGLITFIVMAVLLQIPVIGHIVCGLLGAGVGLLAGVICAAFDAPTWVSWVVGGIFGLGTIGYNLEHRTDD